MLWSAVGQQVCGGGEGYALHRALRCTSNTTPKRPCRPWQATHGSAAASPLVAPGPHLIFLKRGPRRLACLFWLNPGSCHQHYCLLSLAETQVLRTGLTRTGHAGDDRDSGVQTQRRQLVVAMVISAKDVS